MYFIVELPLSMYVGNMLRSRRRKRTGVPRDRWRARRRRRRARGVRAGARGASLITAGRQGAALRKYDSVRVREQEMGERMNTCSSNRGSAPKSSTRAGGLHPKRPSVSRPPLIHSPHLAPPSSTPSPQISTVS